MTERDQIIKAIPDATEHQIEALLQWWIESNLTIEIKLSVVINTITSFIE